MAKKKNKRKMHKRKYGNQDKVIFKKVAAEQQQDIPQKATAAAELFEKVKEAKEIQKRITPPNMTFGEYIECLKKKRWEVKHENNNNY